MLIAILVLLAVILGTQVLTLSAVGNSLTALRSEFTMTRGQERADIKVLAEGIRLVLSSIDWRHRYVADVVEHIAREVVTDQKFLQSIETVGYEPEEEFQG